jgi:ATP-dependent Clp protease, protease subunit
MKIIEIDGIIGWDVFASDVRAAIRDARGDDLTIEVNSPGGSVTEGIAIYNAIRNAPGEKTTLITGLAASMGSYIALAAERVTAEANAIYMIHNAGMIAMGDHNALRKAADIAEGMSKLLALAYATKTGKPDAEIRAMMDEETFLYGEEIKSAGFADEIIGQADGEKSEAILRTRAAVASAEDLIKRVSIDADTDQAAALLSDYMPRAQTNTEKPVAVGSVQAAGPEKKKGVKIMTIETVKAEAPDVANALRDEGIQAERKRNAELAHWEGHNADADRIVKEARASGKYASEIMSQLVSAVAKGNGKQADGENAPVIATKTVETGAGVDALTADDREAMAMFGLTAEDVKNYNKGAK